MMDFNINESNFDGMSRAEMMDLLDRAKEAYYNSGEELLSDAEYDELERLVGLENKTYIGSAKGNYTVKHAYIMGSLAKVQIKEQKDGSVNWGEASAEITSSLRKANGCRFIEASPKLDGCSFSLEFNNVNGKAYLRTCATRGNGQWGSDIKHWFKPLLKTEYWAAIDDAVSSLCTENSDDILCIRGEVLIPEDKFTEEYSEMYTNPRSLVAGVLGLKFEDVTPEKMKVGRDLHFVCYDYRLFTEGKYEELSWMNPKDSSYHKLAMYLNHIGELPDFTKVYEFDGKLTIEQLQQIYDTFDDYRKNKAPYALDGIVLKPECDARQYNESRNRPLDCIAVKFMPMINATEIIDISWRTGKTGEYFPTAIVAPITMPDGKKINRASLHNYNWIVANNCGIGSKVRISLAGDIIPFVYEIVEHSDPTNNMNLPENTFIRQDPNSGTLHLMKEFKEDEENENKFINSASTLNINTIGPAAAKDIYEACKDAFAPLTNIIFVMNEEAYRLIYDRLGDGKSIQNYVENMRNYVRYITLVDIIKSFNFKLCGVKAAEVCAKIILGDKYSVSSLPAESYEWALNKSSQQYYLVMKAIESLELDLEDLKSEGPVDDGIEKTKVILTGSPEAFGYKTKGAFLQQHPELEETTSWKEIQILVTDDLESNSGKMQKAKKAGIPIKTYGEFGIGVSVKKPDVRQPSQPKFDFNSEALF